MAAVLPLLAAAGHAQMNVNSPATPNASAALQVTSGGSKGLLLPSVALTATTDVTTLAGKAHVQGMVVYNTATAADVCPGTYVNDGNKWIRMEGSCVAANTIPSGVVLAQNSRYWIASVYDQDYLPYTVPTAPASLARPVAADGVNETKTVDIQGAIPTTGVTVQIPIATVTGGGGQVKAWTSTITLPAAYSEDGTPSTLQLSWVQQSVTSTSTPITATIKSLNGAAFNAKKLDINAGIGNDNLGFLLGMFLYPYNNAGTLTGYEVRDIPGIPDRMFGLLDNTPAAGQRHNFLYLPLEAKDGKVWLNNDLGANYANINNNAFNLAKQAQSSSDANAYGSLYQWGRYSDGHEFSNSTTTATLSSTDNPGNSNFITNSNNPFDWRVPQNANLWQGESGVNNPCPHGFRLPTGTEIGNLATAEHMTNYSTLASSTLKIAGPGNGERERDGSMQGVLLLWSGTPGATDARAMFVNNTGVYAQNGGLRVMGGRVRCIQN